MIGWVDTETTGLEVRDVPLEAAIVITDDDLVELDAVEILMLPDVPREARWDWLERVRSQPEVLAMHTKSGLITALLDPCTDKVTSTSFANMHLDSWLGSAHGGQTIIEPGQLVLAGASVGFDRKQFERHLPNAARWFHYRQIDVSSIKELAKRWAPDLAGDLRSEDRPHRAMADVRDTIDLLRRYRAAGFVGAPTANDPDADDELGLVRRDPGLIRLISGKLVNPLHLHVDDVDINDIAHALARQCRYNGHVGGFLSVARHSIWVAEHLLVGGHPDHALVGLLHDAAEAYLGDMVRPLKYGAVGREYLVVEAKVEAVVADRFGLPWPMPDLVSEADNFILTHVEKPSARSAWFSTPDEDAADFLALFHRLSATSPAGHADA
ncbi:MAG: oligoribonuclease [Actinomycetia bacterium]|nr:oligoribonuclease [Actinomycetes bacterium]